LDSTNTDSDNVKAIEGIVIGDSGEGGVFNITIIGRSECKVADITESRRKTIRKSFVVYLRGLFDERDWMTTKA
jgi:hypothetical protein